MDVLDHINLYHLETLVFRSQSMDLPTHSSFRRLESLINRKHVRVLSSHFR